MAKHRSKTTRRSIKKAAVAGSIAATATALTMTLAPPTAGAAAITNAREAQAREVALAALPSDLAGLNLPAIFESLGLPIPDIGELFPVPTGPGGAPLPGFKLITTGAPFDALGVLGLNPTWVPPDPNQLAEAINSTEYVPLDLGIDVPAGVIIIPLLTGEFRESPYGLNLVNAGRAAIALCNVVDCGPDTFSLGIPNLRLPTVIGWGYGALATGQAWEQVVADLPNQPGGTAEGAEDGRSLTIVNMVLLRNWGRPDGGVAARFQPILGIFGYNGVTPNMEVERDGDAVLVPNKVDATVEYDPFSEFAAWPNPFTLANNGAAGLFPTYILRGSEDSIPEMLTQVVGALLPGIAGNIAVGVLGDLPTNLVIPQPPGGTLNVPCASSNATVCRFDFTGLIRAFSVPNAGPFELNVRGAVLDLFGDAIEETLGIEIPDDYFATNRFLTFEQNALPLLEPFRYPADFANLFTGGAFGFTNPFADALEPALKILVNLGYTNVTQDMTNPLDPYPRDFSDNFGGEYAPFFTFPEGVDYGRVPQDLVTALAAGVQNSFFTGIPGVRGPLAGPNPLAIIAGLLGLPTGPQELPNLLENFPGLGDIIGGNLGLPAQEANLLAASAAPSGGGADLDAEPFGTGSNDLLERFGETVARSLYIAFERQAPVEHSESSGPVDTIFDPIEGLSASALRLIAALALGPTRLLPVLQGEPNALRELVENTVDAPLWVADPTIYGFRDGATDEAQVERLTELRNTAYQATENVNAAILPNIPSTPTTGAVPEERTVANTSPDDEGPSLNPTGGGTTDGNKFRPGDVVQRTLRDVGDRVQGGLGDFGEGVQDTLNKVFTPTKPSTTGDDTGTAGGTGTPGEGDDGGGSDGSGGVGGGGG